jgi:hypothetical protein
MDLEKPFAQSGGEISSLDPTSYQCVYRLDESFLAPWHDESSLKWLLPLLISRTPTRQLGLEFPLP